MFSSIYKKSSLSRTMRICLNVFSSIHTNVLHWHITHILGSVACLWCLWLKARSVFSWPQVCERLEGNWKIYNAISSFRLVKKGKEWAGWTLQTEPTQYLVNWLAEWPQEVAAQFPAQFSWRVKEKKWMWTISYQ